MEKYIVDFESNFVSILGIVDTHLHTRQLTRKCRQTVFTRYENKKRLLRLHEEEQQIKIYGDKVKKIVNQNYSNKTRLDLSRHKDCEIV